jgi:pimeloyl-ACP methyl ester carboxylesterase
VSIAALAVPIEAPRPLAVGCLRGPAGAGAAAAPRIFLVHAAGGAAKNFGSLLRRLGADAVALDLPGRGRTPGEAPRSIGESAEILLAVARALAPEGRVVLAGHSMGAAVALAAAAEAGAARVAGVVAIAAGARLQISRGLVEAARRDFAGFLAALGAAGSPAATIAALGEAGAETVARDLEASLGFDLLLPARRHGGPLLVIGGGRDHTAPPAVVRELAEGAPRAELVMLEGAGHILPVERPDEVAAAIRAFAERSPGLAAASDLPRKPLDRG